MVSTSRFDLWDAMWSLKDHGKSHKLVFGTDHAPGFRWLHERFGSNFRLTEFQSAIGRIQLQRLPEWTSILSRNAQFLIDALKDLPAVRVPLPPDDITNAWYKFYAFVNPLFSGTLSSLNLNISLPWHENCVTNRNSRNASSWRRRFVKTRVNWTFHGIQRRTGFELGVDRRLGRLSGTSEIPAEPGRENTRRARRCAGTNPETAAERRWTAARRRRPLGCRARPYFPFRCRVHSELPDSFSNCRRTILNIRSGAMSSCTRAIPAEKTSRYS